MPSRGINMKRLQFELPMERVKELDALAERTGLKTRVQLINAALTLFEWAVRERQAGRIIASMDEESGKYKELDMPGLPVVQKERAKAIEAVQTGGRLKAEEPASVGKMTEAEAAVILQERATE
jgi:hypothetical protein